MHHPTIELSPSELQAVNGGDANDSIDQLLQYLQEQQIQMLPVLDGFTGDPTSDGGFTLM